MLKDYGQGYKRTMNCGIPKGLLTDGKSNVFTGTLRKGYFQTYRNK